MSKLTFFRAFSPAMMMTGLVAVLVGYASSVAIILQALDVAGLDAAQTGGWLMMLGIGMGVTTIGLSLWYKMPVLTAWSTPGIALLVTSLSGVTINEAVGVFIFASGLMFLCGVTGIFARLMNYIPRALASAMLAGILLRFGLTAFGALNTSFVLC
ncbi:TPA: benzoate/H(+) symporter BenE family transporter, partial [Morganella morganii]